MPDRGVEVLEAPAKRFDVAHALKLRLRKGMTYAEIALVMDAPASTVANALARFNSLLEDPEGTRAYRENEAELLDAVSAKIVAHMAKDEVIAKASLNNASFALAKVHEARRLIRGESTANVGIRTTLVLAAHGDKQLSSDNEDIDQE